MVDGLNNFEGMETPGPTLPGPMYGIDLSPEVVPTTTNSDGRCIPSIIQWPMKLEDSIDVLFSHNELIALWYNSKEYDNGLTRFWVGEAWALPDGYKSIKIERIIGIIPEHVLHGDVINIFTDATDDVQKDLPKKSHDIFNCCETDPKRVEEIYHISEDEIKRKTEIRDGEYLIATKDGKYYMDTPSGVYSSKDITNMCITVFKEEDNKNE